MADDFLRIAHAHGNRPDRLQQALESSVDGIETDIWYRTGALWVRHERRLGWLPLVGDWRRNAFFGFYPGDIRFLRWYLRFDPKIRLEALLERVAGKKRLVLDCKGEYQPGHRKAFAQKLEQLLRVYRQQNDAIVCGQNWGLLDEVRRVATHLDVRYTINRPQQWTAYLAKIRSQEIPRSILLNYRLLDEEMAKTLREESIGFICWTVDEREDARRVIKLGASGVISNDLDMMSSLESVQT